MPYQHFNVYLCRRLHLPLAQVWPTTRNWD
jgi:hypothetical protein